MYQELKTAAETAARELIEVAKLEEGDLMVVGCSSSEVGGQKIGTDSNVDIADAVFSGIYGVLKEKNIFLAAHELGVGSVWINQLKLICDKENVRPHPGIRGRMAQP